MDYFYAILSLLGGLGCFLIGMNMLSSNMKKLADSKIKTLLSSKTNNRFIGMGIGVVVTMIAQSSSLTTVMVVGLVNAGILSLLQATAIIMGANIGTTITAQIVALQSFNFIKIAVSLTFIGSMIGMFAKKNKTRDLGLVLSSLGLIFLGLEFMSSSMRIFRENEAITLALSSISNPFLLLLLGIIITGVVQSSSAVTSIIISMAAAGIEIGSGGNSVLFVILGTNIGTCVTAILSGIGASTTAKKAGLIHLLFNLFGSVIFMIVLLIWNDFMNVTFAKWFEFPATQIAMFHTFFNVSCVLIFLPFANVFVKLSSIIIKDKKIYEQRNIIMDERLLNSPLLALDKLYQETIDIANYSIKTYDESFQAFIEKNLDSKDEILRKIVYAQKSSEEITKYLVMVSSKDESYNDEKIIQKLHYAINDISRITEVADNFIKYTKHYVEDNLIFSDDVIESLEEMNKKINELFIKTMDVFSLKKPLSINDVDQLENEIDSFKKRLVDDHIRRLNEGKCKPENSSVFINLVGNMERIADHLTYIAYEKRK